MGVVRRAARRTRARWQAAPVEPAVSGADGRPSPRRQRPGPAPRERSAADLDALATHARERLALYRRKVYLGRGQATRLAELERMAAGANDRARRARPPRDAT